MWGRTRKHHTDETEESMSYDEAMAVLLGGESQGAVMLRGLRNREGITQAELGKLLDIEQSNISKMERGKRQIGKNIAMRLAKLFHTDYRLFL